ncbi:hypothetical protein RB195_008591 [Necator americanus]|uniref:CUB domain-containing protein n=1 Tax=Necator americanus TaxID=51031 RepID=A0ABR1CQ68_NECAM
MHLNSHDTDNRRTSTCDCPKQIYGEEYDYAEIKKPAMNYCDYQHCVFEIEPGHNTSLALTLQSILLSGNDIVRIYQYFTVNDTEIELLHCAEVRRTHENYVFTAALGVGFRIYSYSHKRYFSTASFTFSFDRVDSDVKTCPYPLLLASSSFKRIPSFERPGQISCPFRILPSVAGHRLLLVFNSLKGIVFDQKGEEEKFTRRISVTGTHLVSPTDSVDILLTRSNVYETTSFDISYKEFVEDPCFCNKTDLIVGDTPTYVTSPGFPDLYCSNFRCKTKFLHNTSMHDDKTLTFVVTVHFLNTDKHDYVDFSTDGLFTERLNGTHEDVKIVMSGDVMETEFVTDRTVSRHGYNMSVISVQMPTECICPHKGVKIMRTSGSLQMDVPGHCTVVYCKWEIPYFYDQLQFTAMFNFSSEFDSLTVTTGSDVRRFTTITGKELKRHWKRNEHTEPTTVLYQRAFPANYSLDSQVASFLVKWMGSEDCFCDELSPRIHEAVVGDWRELTSPAYPLPYCGDLECVYRIVAPTGHHVVLNITDFYTEPYNDVLALFDGINTTGRHMDVFYGKKRFPYLIHNENETLSLVFKTDHDVSYDGFRILFSAAPNEDFIAPLKSQLHTSVIIIFILSIMLIAAIAVAVYRRAPRLFDNPVYAGSVSYSDDTVETNPGSDVFG